MPEIMKMENKSFISPFSQNELLSVLDLPNFYGYALVEQDLKFFGILAYAFYFINSVELHLLRICVHENFRKQGFGKKLMAHCRKEALFHKLENIRIEVRTNNKAAIGFYDSIGFQRDYSLPDYYEDTGEAALIMKMKI